MVGEVDIFETIKLTLIRKKALSIFIDDWKPLMDFLHKNKRRTLIYGFDAEMGYINRERCKML